MQIRGSRPKQCGQRPYKPKQTRTSPLFFPQALSPHTPKFFQNKILVFPGSQSGVLSCYEHSYPSRWFCCDGSQKTLILWEDMACPKLISLKKKIKIKESPRGDVACSMAQIADSGWGHVCSTGQRKIESSAEPLQYTPLSPAQTGILRDYILREGKN